MVEQQTDFSQAYNFLYKIDRRIGLLEKDATFIEKQIIYLDDKKFKTFNILTMELEGLRSSLAELKSHLGKCAHSMSMLSRDMKDSVKKDDIQALDSSIESIQFEEYVTRKDIDRGVI